VEVTGKPVSRANSRSRWLASLPELMMPPPGLDLVEVAFDLRLVAFHLDLLRSQIGPGRELHVLRDIDHHRPRPAIRRDVERLVQHARKIVHALHEIIVLGARPRDADRVAFLERVIADEVRRHLARDAHERDRVHQRIGQAGHRIGGAGAGGDQHAADLAGGARIAFGRVHGALLMTHQNVLQLLLLEHRIIDRQDGAARVAEDVFDALVEHRLDHHFGAGHFLGHRSAPLSLRLFACRQQKRAFEALARTASVAGGCQPPPAVRAVTTIRMLRNMVLARHFLARRL
jgi:hypothetical protein